MNKISQRMQQKPIRKAEKKMPPRTFGKPGMKDYPGVELKDLPLDPATKRSTEISDAERQAAMKGGRQPAELADQIILRRRERLAQLEGAPKLIQSNLFGARFDADEKANWWVETGSDKLNKPYFGRIRNDPGGGLRGKDEIRRRGMKTPRATMLRNDMTHTKQARDLRRGKSQPVWNGEEYMGTVSVEGKDARSAQRVRNYYAGNPYGKPSQKKFPIGRDLPARSGAKSRTMR
jgi:hypothetical protein